MQKGGLRTKGIFKISQKANPLITVITVVFNCVESIENTITSIVNQNYKNLEYIIIDGGSVDGTIDIIKKYEDKIDYWQSEPDKGIYDAMNKAIDLSSGDYINFMNCGDIFVNNHILEDVVADLNDEEYDVVFGDVINRWNIGDEIKKADENSIMGFCHQSAFTSAKLLKKYKFDPTYRICADRNFYKQIYDNEVIRKKYINIPISIFQCENSLSVDNNLKRFKENSKIENYSKRKYVFGVIKIYIKDFIIKKLPFIVDFYRSKRISK